MYYAGCWGVLTIALINYINPVIDKILEFISKKISSFIIKSFITIITLFMTFDGFITCVAIDNFLVRVAQEYNVTINGVEEDKNNIILAKTFSNEKMMMTYPNIIVVNDKEENIYLESLLKDVKNYYYKFNE